MAPSSQFLATSNTSDTSTAAAGGFRYTPPSYLLRTKVENRPWNDGMNTPHGIDEDEDDRGAMAQEQRPSRISTNIDAHFQQRVQKKQNRYRDIIKGSDVDGDDTHPTRDECEEESILLLTTASVLKVESEGWDCHYNNDGSIKKNNNNNNNNASSNNNVAAAREARKQRLMGSSGGGGGTVAPVAPVAVRTTTAAAAAPSASSSAKVTLKDQNMAKTLRAERLRSSLRQTMEDVDVQTKLELRRLEEKRESATSTTTATTTTATATNATSSSIVPDVHDEDRKRILLEEETKHHTAKQQPDELDPNRWMMERSPILTKAIRTSDRPKKQRRHPSTTTAAAKSQKNSNSVHRRNVYDEDEDEDDEEETDDIALTICAALSGGVGGGRKSDTAVDYEFFEEMIATLRNSGLFQGCVSKCYGGGGTKVRRSTAPAAMRIPSNEDSSTDDIDEYNIDNDLSFDQNDNKNNHTMHKVYAKYRE
jgi:hypothetical protein